MTINIKETKYADSRTRGSEKVDKNKLDSTNKEHILNVASLLAYSGNRLIQQGLNHDWTKIQFLDELVQNNTNPPESGFADGDWYQRHIKMEAHHPQSLVHPDITLWDIFEMIADCLEAGIGRFGEVDIDYFDISDEVLQTAYLNTVKEMMTQIKLRKEDTILPRYEI